MSTQKYASLPERFTADDFARISFDVVALTDRLFAVEDWAKLVAAHIYLDHILMETLLDRIADIDVYLKGGHKTFSDKHCARLTSSTWNWQRPSGRSTKPGTSSHIGSTSTSPTS
jgi:hypothetical protein